MKKWFVVGCLMLFFVIGPIECLTQAEMRKDVSIPIQAEDIDDFLLKDGRVHVPTCEVTYFRPTNPLGLGELVDLVELTQIKALIPALSQAKILSKVKSNKYEQYSYDGAKMMIDYQKGSGESNRLWLESIFMKDQVMFSIEGSSTSLDPPEFYYLLESKELKEQILTLCHWKTYRRKELTDTASIRVNRLEIDAVSGEPLYVFVTEITNAKEINPLVQNIIRAKAHNHNFNLPPFVKLEFVLSDGQVYDAYTRDEARPSNTLMQAGGRQLELKEGALTYICSLLPERPMPTD